MKDLSTAESTADVVSYMRLVGTQAKAAARVMARATTAAKNMALNAAADAILAQQEQIIAANAADVSNARQNGH
ncbi:MAG: gamma-glutamyl-phosphate reductase, partial [Rhodocyclaceae bacterium]|nr:gamma-glutamyl-phosphate reductase [Rhodocyclaceae bacterium]